MFELSEAPLAFREETGKRIRTGPGHVDILKTGAEDGYCFERPDQAASSLSASMRIAAALITPK